MSRIKVPKFQGVYYREAEKARHSGKPDRCYDITYRDQSGKFVWEKVGWASEGYTAVMASQVRAERMREVRHGETFIPKREKGMTFGDAWEKYFEWARVNRKSHTDDAWRYHKHLEKALAGKQLSEISPFLLEKVKSQLLKKGLSAQTIKHVLGLVRQVFNKCREWDLYEGTSPTDKVKFPSTADQNRQRFLSPEESKLLLEEVRKHSEQLYQICVFAMQTGMRASEIFRLKWADMQTSTGTIHILKTKNGRARTAVMTADIREILKLRDRGAPNELLFPSSAGHLKEQISGTFRRIVERLGFNDGVDDPRQRVVFHSLRHTFGSWLTMSGAHPRTIMELMGHSRLEQTMRYSHLAPDQKRQAVNDLEAMLVRSSDGCRDRDRASETR